MPDEPRPELRPELQVAHRSAMSDELLVAARRLDEIVARAGHVLGVEFRERAHPVSTILSALFSKLDHLGDSLAATYHQGNRIMDNQSRIDADFAEMASTLTDITSQLKTAAANATQRTADALGPIADKLDAFKTALDTAAGKVAAAPAAPAQSTGTAGAAGTTTASGSTVLGSAGTGSAADPSTGRGA